jgi:hypothetical protein
MRKTDKTNEENYNNQNYKMRIIEYKNYNDIIVEFQDSFKAQVHTNYTAFKNGGVRNPYAPNLCGVGIVGNKYPTKDKNNKRTKEYAAWSSMITRCYTKTYVNNENFYHRYEDKVICNEWLLFDNFYEWLHSQENFDKWLNGNHWEVDKDILIKNNKIYSPETCCLVPHDINTLFIKSNKIRGDFPIGVTYKTRDNIFEAQCNVNSKETYLGRYDNALDAFYAYKNFKENLIKKTAQEEYDKENITKRCYEAMMSYEVEITD